MLDGGVLGRINLCPHKGELRLGTSKSRVLPLDH